jgi:hypothetical protein
VSIAFPRAGIRVEYEIDSFMYHGRQRALRAELVTD